MITYRDFALQGVSAVGFAQKNELKPVRVLAGALRRWTEIYDAEPISLPMPDDVPEEVPAVILSSSDGRNRLEVGHGRISVHWRRVDVEDADLAGLCTTLVDRLATAFEFAEVAVGRLGMIVVRQARQPDPGIVLSRQFCRDEKIQGPLNRPEGFELHAHKTFAITAGLNVNSWVRIRTDKEGEIFNLISVQQDINTLASERAERSFARDSLFELATAFAGQFDQIIELYFPAEA